MAALSPPERPATPEPPESRSKRMREDGTRRTHTGCLATPPGGTRPWLAVLDDQASPFNAPQRAFIQEFLALAINAGIPPRTCFVALRYMEHVYGIKVPERPLFRYLWAVCWGLAIDIEEDDDDWVRAPRAVFAPWAKMMPSKALQGGVRDYVYRALEYRVFVRYTLADELVNQMQSELIAEAALAALPYMLERVHAAWAYRDIAAAAIGGAGERKMACAVAAKAQCAMAETVEMLGGIGIY